MDNTRPLPPYARRLLLFAMLVATLWLDQACDDKDPAAAQGQDAAQVPRPAGRIPAGDAAITLDTFQEVAARVNAGVVNISTSKIVRPTENPFREMFGDDFMERFFGPHAPQMAPQRQTSLGSGFMIDDAGHVLTNRHVIAGADEIEVEFPGGRRLPAKLVGRDARTDVALLKLDATQPVTVLPLGESSKMDPGEWVIAIGNPFGFGNSVTAGVVSYRGRPLPLGTQGTSVDMLQTDASINPGNSGGPLLNLAGEVVGINTMIVTRGLSQSAGVGFAVPIDAAKAILPQLRETGRVIRGWLGVAVQPLTEDLAKTYGREQAKGAVVSDLTSGSPAEKARLQPGDVILSVDGHAVDDGRALSEYIASKPPGTTVQLRVLQQGQEKTVPVTLGTFPDDEEDEAGGGRAGGGPLGMALLPLGPQDAERAGLPGTTRGVVMAGVEVGKPAEKAGLRQGDIILSVNGREVSDAASFQQAIGQAKQQGAWARLRVRRGTAYVFLPLQIS